MTWQKTEQNKTIRRGNSDTYNPNLKRKFLPLLRTNYILSIALGVYNLISELQSQLLGLGLLSPIQQMRKLSLRVGEAICF